MDCNFSEHIERAKIAVRIEDHELLQSDYFRYLGSVISKDGEIDEDIKYMIKAGWLK